MSTHRSTRTLEKCTSSTWRNIIFEICHLHCRQNSGKKLLPKSLLPVPAPFRGADTFFRPISSQPVIPDAPFLRRRAAVWMHLNTSIKHDKPCIHVQRQVCWLYEALSLLPFLSQTSVSWHPWLRSRQFIAFIILFGNKDKDLLRGKVRCSG